MAGLIQRIYDFKLGVYRGECKSAFVSRWALRSARLVERVAHDPDVVYDVGEHPLTIPFSHELPRIWSVLPDYSFNLARLAALCSEAHSDATMIDVGGNIGDSVAIVRTASQIPVLTVEGDSNYLRYLEKNVSGYDDVEIEPSFVGREDANRSLRLVAEKGTAHLEPAEAGSSTVAIRSLETIVAAHPRFESARLLKIDTDGYDQEIIMGSRGFLQSAKPCIFLEYDPYFLEMHGDDGLSLFPFLGSIGYSDMVIWDNAGALLLSAKMADTLLIEQLHYYYSGRGSKTYMDIACFHADDHELFEAVLAEETQHRISTLQSAQPRGQAG